MNLSFKLRQQLTFFSILISYHPLSSPVGRCAARGRSAARCTGWRTATCGAPPAAGKRPARDLPTERLHAGAKALLPFTRDQGEGHHSACIWFFFSSKSQLSVKLWPRPLSAPLNHSSCGRNQRTAESPFYIAVQDSKYCLAIPIVPHFGETPVQLNSVKMK